MGVSFLNRKGDPFIMAKMLIINSKQFDHIMAVEKVASNVSEMKQLKRKLKSDVIEFDRDKYNSFKKATKDLIDNLVYLASDKGFSFMGYKTMVEKYDVSESTCKRAVSFLKNTGLVLVGYRRNPNSNGYKTPVIFFKNHPNYEHHKNTLGFDKDLVDDTVEKAETSTETRLQEDKKGTTYNSTIKDFNNLNLSIEDKIEKLPAPTTIKIRLIKNKNRILKDSIKLDDILVVFEVFKNRLNEYQFSLVLDRVLKRVKGKIWSISGVLERSIHNYINDMKTVLQGNVKPVKPIRTEMLPEWFDNEDKPVQKKKSPEEIQAAQLDLEKMLAKLRE